VKNELLCEARVPSHELLVAHLSKQPQNRTQWLKINKKGNEWRPFNKFDSSHNYVRVTIINDNLTLEVVSFDGKTTWMQTVHATIPKTVCASLFSSPSFVFQEDGLDLEYSLGKLEVRCNQSLLHGYQAKSAVWRTTVKIHSSD